jgi:hypothetical protein
VLSTSRHFSDAQMPGRRESIEAALRRLAPAIPDHECSAIVDHAMDSRGLRTASPETAAWLSMVAYIRHQLTEYDDLLAQGYDTDSARFFVLDDINAILGEWKVRRRIDANDME